LNLTAGTAKPAATASVPGPRPWLRPVRTVRSYVALTKPRIIELLLITTVPAMVLAAKGWPGWGLVLATVLGGYLAAGGAGAINCFLDRDVDRVMDRTRRRPLVTGQVTPARALLFGALLGVLAFIEKAVLVNLLSALLSLIALGFSVFVYTLWLKRSTPQNIVIGGAAGAMPPVIGWTAVTGHFAWAPLVMFAIIFLWTPPHFWALSLRYYDDYERAHIPMLPVVRGRGETVQQILLYSAILVAASFALLATRTVGIVYGASASVLGIGFLGYAWRLARRPDTGTAMSLFKYSISYLSLLFIAIAADQFAQHLLGRLW
jgi:protoheme IX farnesyltransferase